MQRTKSDCTCSVPGAFSGQYNSDIKMSARLLSVVAVLFVCATSAVLAAPSYSYSECSSRPTLTCLLVPTKSEDLEGKIGTVYGSATFTPTWSSHDPGCEEEGETTGSGPECLTRIEGTIYGLGDDTPHGWHIHEKGDISSSDGSAAGGHYNPANVSSRHRPAMKLQKSLQAMSRR